MSQSKICKDCEPGSKRPAPWPGPRCATHHRAVKKARQVAAHGRRVEAVYGITQDEYNWLYKLQGGKCAWCQRATGKVKRLAVDHDHKTGEVRGLLCGPCNRTIGQFGDSPEAIERGAEYLRNPPARLLEKLTR